MLKPVFIGKVKINYGLVLSPMSGVTTVPFRRLIKALNGCCVGMTVSEFISVEALTRKVARSYQMMERFEEESPYCIQIFGYEPSKMAEGAVIAQDHGAHIVDINCGCPAPKVVKKGGGAELMRQLGHLAKVIREVRKRVSIPLTVKFRSGWDASSINAVEAARIAESEGVDAISIHPRTRKQMYRGQADWNLVAEVCDAVSVPVFGSGDIIDVDSFKRRTSFGVSGFFIGRGALINPFIFSDIVRGKDTDLRQKPHLVFKVINFYLSLLKEYFPKERLPGKIKQLIGKMAKGYPWRKQIMVAESFEEIEQILLQERFKIDCNEGIALC